MGRHLEVKQAKKEREKHQRTNTLTLLASSALERVIRGGEKERLKRGRKTRGGGRKDAAMYPGVGLATGP